MCVFSQFVLTALGLLLKRTCLLGRRWLKHRVGFSHPSPMFLVFGLGQPLGLLGRRKGLWVPWLCRPLQ